MASLVGFHPSPNRLSYLSKPSWHFAKVSQRIRPAFPFFIIYGIKPFPWITVDFNFPFNSCVKY
jgi:hypothetical protein